MLQGWVVTDECYRAGWLLMSVTGLGSIMLTVEHAPQIGWWLLMKMLFGLG